MTGPGKADDLLGQIAAIKGLPPVHLWNPDFCGNIDMRIARDGTWYYLGTPIGRKPMVKLFSSIIRRDGDDYFLVTPVERVGITVDAAPFLAVTLEVSGEGEQQVLRMTTLTQDSFEVDIDHPLRVEIDQLTEEPAPYVTVRGNLEALVHRNVFYQLVDLAVEAQTNGQTCLGVWSCGHFFMIGQLP